MCPAKRNVSNVIRNKVISGIRKTGADKGLYTSMSVCRYIMFVTAIKKYVG